MKYSELKKSIAERDSKIHRLERIKIVAVEALGRIQQRDCAQVGASVTVDRSMFGFGGPVPPELTAYNREAAIRAIADLLFESAFFEEQTERLEGGRMARTDYRLTVCKPPERRR